MPTKNGGSEMCDVLLGEVPGCVTMCDRGRGSKLAKNSVTYFMDGPLHILTVDAAIAISRIHVHGISRKKIFRPIINLRKQSIS